ncbi:hypothetical protein WMF30_52645 [Sorangium sp. So ce134]
MSGLPRPDADLAAACVERLELLVGAAPVPPLLDRRAVGRAHVGDVDGPVAVHVLDLDEAIAHGADAEPLGARTIAIPLLHGHAVRGAGGSHVQAFAAVHRLDHVDAIGDGRDALLERVQRLVVPRSLPVDSTATSEKEREGGSAGVLGIIFDSPRKVSVGAT